MEPFFEPLQWPFWHHLFTRRCRFLWRLWLSNKSCFQKGVKLATLIWRGWDLPSLLFIIFHAFLCFTSVQLREKVNCHFNMHDLIRKVCSSKATISSLVIGLPKDFSWRWVKRSAFTSFSKLLINRIFFRTFNSL